MSATSINASANLLSALAKRQRGLARLSHQIGNLAAEGLSGPRPFAMTPAAICRAREGAAACAVASADLPICHHAAFAELSFCTNLEGCFPPSVVPSYSLSAIPWEASLIGKIEAHRSASASGNALLLSLGTAFLLSGCMQGPVAYYRTDVTQQQMNQDYDSCRIEGLQQVPTDRVTAAQLDLNFPLRQNVVAACMSRRGYIEVTLPACNPGVVAPNLTQPAVLTDNTCIYGGGRYYAFVSPTTTPASPVNRER